jgi:hypothetical protein
MGIDNVVTDLEVADCRLELEIGYGRLVDYLLRQFRNWSLLS